MSFYWICMGDPAVQPVLQPLVRHARSRLVVTYRGCKIVNFVHERRKYHCLSIPSFIYSRNGPDKKFTRFASGLTRRELRILVGHITLIRHVTVMKIQEDPLCPACVKKTIPHSTSWGGCCANMRIRYSVLEHA